MIAADNAGQMLIPSLETLSQGRRCLSLSFTSLILPMIVWILGLRYPQMQVQRSRFHIEEAKRHNSALLLRKTRELGFPD
jgi:hypothetical protein